MFGGTKENVSGRRNILLEREEGIRRNGEIFLLVQRDCFRLSQSMNYDSSFIVCCLRRRNRAITEFDDPPSCIGKASGILFPVTASSPEVVGCCGGAGESVVASVGGGCVAALVFVTSSGLEVLAKSCFFSETFFFSNPSLSLRLRRFFFATRFRSTSREFGELTAC